MFGQLARQLAAAWREIRGLRGDFWTAMGLTGLAAGIGLLLPGRARVLVEQALPSGVTAQVAREVGILVVIVALTTGFSMLRRFVLERLAIRMVTRLRRRMFAHVLSVAPGDVQRAEGGLVLSAFMNDLSRYLEVTKSIFATVIPSAALAVIYAGAMIWFSWQLSLCLLLMVVPLIVATNWFAGRIHLATQRTHEGLSSMMRELTEGLAGLREIKLFNLEAKVLDDFDRVGGSLERTLIGRERLLSGHPYAVAICVALGVAAILLASSIAVNAGVLTFGDLTGFLVCVTLAYPPLQELSHSFGQLAQLPAVRDRLDAVLEMPSEPNPPVRPDTEPGDSGIRFERVSFGYDREKDVLSDIDLDILPGERIAIVGPSGAGKSTLLELLPMFRRPRSGRILIGGVDIARIPLDRLRGMIGLVQQVPFLFRGSLLENLRAGAPDAPHALVMQAARAARVDEFAEALAEGYDTQIEPGGTNLSVGQRQRIAVARVLLKDPPILILDEPTSALDAASEAHVVAALRNAAHRRTTLIVAHRLSTLRDIDRIVVLQEGRIVETGDMEELVARNGVFSDLWHHAQSGNQPQPSAEPAAAVHT